MSLKWLLKPLIATALHGGWWGLNHCRWRLTMDCFIHGAWTAGHLMRPNISTPMLIMEPVGTFHRCYKLQGNKFPIYRTVENDGFFLYWWWQEHLVELTISDASGNEYSRSFTIQSTAFSVGKAKSISWRNKFEKNWATTLVSVLWITIRVYLR